MPEAEKIVTQSKPPEKYKRQSPQTELDLALMTTDALWGRPEVSPELKNRLNKLYKTTDKDGKEGYEAQSLWGLLSYYTRDMRLANLSVMNGEFEYVKYFIDLAGDCLQEGLTRPFVIALSRAATVLELSQSKGGFLRNRQRTQSFETRTSELNPPNRKIMGSGKKKEG